MHISLRPRALSFVALLVLAACNVSIGESSGGSADGFHHTIDTSLAPPPDARPNPKPLAAVADGHGGTSVFVENQLWVAPRDRAELDALLARTGGRILEDDAVPAPPAHLGVSPPAEATAPTAYLVEIDPSRMPLDDFDDDAARAGLRGAPRISSEAGARLLARIVRERAAGLVIGPNFVGRPALVQSSREQPDGAGGFVDAFANSRFAATGSKSNVVGAWQLATQSPPPRRARVAIVDDGFWLGPSGRPMTSIAGATGDFPEEVAQHDFIDGDDNAGGRCSDSRGDCGWHGNDSASLATARLDNQYGSAGTGALAADPMFMRVDFSAWTVARAIRTATAWGADVISMSLSTCNDDVFCGELGPQLYPAMRGAQSANVIMVAAAGNGGDDGVGDEAGGQPCRGDHVICVGALANDSLSAIGYSNYGGRVDVWAPTNLPASPDGDSVGINTATGTSAATPFVAGIVATMRAYDRTLSADRASEILRATAWTDSPDPKVTHAVNALRAVSQAAGRPLTAILRPAGGFTFPLNRDFVLAAETVDGEGLCSPARCSFAWTPAPVRTNPPTATFRFLTEGTHRIEVTSGGMTDAVDVLVQNSPPTALVDEPAPGQVAYVGEPITFRGYGLDPNEGAGPGDGRLDTGCTWTHAGSGEPIGTGCTMTTSFPVTGSFNVALRVTDSQGMVSTAATTTVSVLHPPANPGPDATATLSAPNYEGGYGRDLPMTLTGSGSADPDAPFTYRWSATSYALGSATTVYANDVEIATTASASWTPESTPGLLDPTSTGANSCYQGQWVRINLRVRDSLGSSGTIASKLVKVYCRLL